MATLVVSSSFKPEAQVLKLIHTVVDKFDALTYPKPYIGYHLTNAPKVSFAPMIELIQGKPRTDTNVVKLFNPLPNELVVKVLDNAENIGHFCLITQVFDRYTPAKDPVGIVSVANESAKHRLRSLGVEVSYLDSPIKQLFSHIFLEVFKNGTFEEKKQLIALAKPLHTYAQNTRTTFQKMRIFAEDLFSKLFGNLIIRFLTVACVAITTMRIYSAVQEYIQKQVIPSTGHFLMRRAPLQAIVLSNVAHNWVNYLLGTQVSCWLFFRFFIPFTPFAGTRTMRLAERVCLLPSLARSVVKNLKKRAESQISPLSVLTRIVPLSWNATRELSDMLKKMNENSKNQLSEIESQQAYRTWMQCINNYTFSQ